MYTTLLGLRLVASQVCVPRRRGGSGGTPESFFFYSSAENVRVCRGEECKGAEYYWNDRQTKSLKRQRGWFTYRLSLHLYNRRNEI